MSDVKASPYDVATVDPETGHAWVRGKDLAPWWPSLAAASPEIVSCLRCGIIRRADGKNKPCRGPARIALRGEGEGT